MVAAMAHRVTHAAPVQAALLLDVPRPPKVALVGQLERDAELRNGVDGSAHLIVQLRQADDSLPLVAVRHAKADEAEVLRLRARGMHKGTAVLIVGLGLTTGSHDGRHVLKLRQVRDIVCAHLEDFMTDHDDGGAA